MPRMLRSVLALLLALASAPAFAQTRPLLTEEAATAPEGTLVLEAGGDYIRREPNFLTGGERDRWDGPVLRLVYSAARNVELDLEWVGRVGAIADPDFGSVSDFGDVTLRAKVNFLEEDRAAPGIAARFAVTLPETSFGNGLGPNALRMSAQLIVSRTLGRTAFHANAGLAIHDEVERPHEQRDFFAYGLAVVRPVGSRLWAVAEVAGRAGKGAPGAEERAEARAGLRFGGGRIRWDAALRRGLAAADGGWGITAGLAWTIRP